MNRKYQAPMPPNTLTNADGTPYSAGYDEKSFGQIAYETFVCHADYRKILFQRTGYRSEAPLWQSLSFVEQEMWVDVASAVIRKKEMQSQ